MSDKVLCNVSSTSSGHLLNIYDGYLSYLMNIDVCDNVNIVLFVVQILP